MKKLVLEIFGEKEKPIARVSWAGIPPKIKKTVLKHITDREQVLGTVIAWSKSDIHKLNKRDTAPEL